MNKLTFSEDTVPTVTANQEPYFALPIGPEGVVARILLRIPKAPIGWLSAEATLAGLRTLGRKNPR